MVGWNNVEAFSFSAPFYPFEVLRFGLFVLGICTEISEFRRTASTLGLIRYRREGDLIPRKSPWLVKLIMKHWKEKKLDLTGAKASLSLGSGSGTTATVSARASATEGWLK